MFKKLIIVAVFAVTPMILAEDSSADHCSYRSYRAPVVRHSHRVPVYHGAYARPPVRSYYYPGAYRSYGRYGAGYGGYGAGYGRYGGFGGYPYYGNTIGIGRSGFSLSIGF
jgi:hypothetical protein